MNAVVIAVMIMLTLSLVKVDVVASLTIGVISGGIIAGMSVEKTLAVFSNGLAVGHGIKSRSHF